jgi:predicted DNA-binding transcriptional regulator YafY
MTLLEEQGFQVNPRMLQRDLEKLSAYFPIECDSSEKPYRWGFVEGYKSNLPALDPVTALSWILAEEHLKPLLPAIAYDKLHPQFKNAREYLDAQSHNLFNNWQHQIKAVPNGKALIPADVSKEVWYSVTESILNTKVLRIDYLSREQRKLKSYELHALGIVVRHSSTYLLAMINDYEDIRQFALHRIKAITVLEKSSRHKENFNVEDYVDSGAFGYPIDQKDIKLKVLIDKETAWHLEETPLSYNQTLEKTSNPDKVLLTAMVPNDQQTQWWLMGFGSKIEILEPLELRQKFKNMYQNLSKLYS